MAVCPAGRVARILCRATSTMQTVLSGPAQVTYNRELSAETAKPEGVSGTVRV